MPRIMNRSGILVGLISGFCVLVIALIWINHFHQINTDRNDTIAAAMQKNSNLAVALEQYTIRTIRNADAVLQLVKMEYDRTGDAIDINRLLFTHDLGRDFFRGVALTNEKGELVNVNINFHHPLNFSDRDYFIYHLKNKYGGLFISKPVLSRTIGKVVIVLSRRLNKKDGSFAGVVALQMEPTAFTSFYARANLRTNDIISLIAPDGITYARRTGNKESYGEDISSSPLFVHVKQDPDSFYFAKDAIRGIPSYFSYRRMEEYPIIATVGSAQADVLAGYYKRASRDRNSAIIISALVFLFSALFSVILLHRKRMAEKFVEEEQRYQRRITEQVILAQEKERSLIGHELHDNVNQVLTTVKLYLEMALHKKETREELLPKSIHLVMASINEIRNLSRDLSAPTLGSRSLVDSIKALVEMVSSSSGLCIGFDHTSYRSAISMNQKLAVYRIVQEQLNNIIKHARAKKVSISIKQNETATILVIKDDGRGFDPLTRRNGIGLNNIASRANVFNGKVKIESEPGCGCTLTVYLPIEVDAKEKV